MVSIAQMQTCRKLSDIGMVGVGMPHGMDSPIPGLCLMADAGHTKLFVVQADGTAVDLLLVWRLAEDCVRNWQKENTMPAFVGDFKRLAPLAEALNAIGRFDDQSRFPRAAS